MIEFDAQIMPTARAMSLLFPRRARLSKCAKNFTLPRARCPAIPFARDRRLPPRGGASGRGGCAGISRLHLCRRRRRLRADSVQERANREPERRNRVVRAFPSGKLPLGTPGAVFSEAGADRASRGRLAEEPIARAASPMVQKAPMSSCGYGGTGADSPIGGRGHRRRVGIRAGF